MSAPAGDVELRQLRALVAVVDRGGFTRAAASLGTSQAAVSRSIAGLEAVLGARVLRRTTREVSLTPAGARVLGHARRVVEEVAALVRAAGDLGGQLSVGYAWSALGRHTTAVQAAWARDHQGAELVFLQSNTPTAGLREGLVDVAVLRRPVDDPRFATALVGVEQRFAAVASGTPWPGGATSPCGTSPAAPWPWTGRPGPPARAVAPDAQPAGTRSVDGVDEWLTVIAADRAVGMTSEATARQHPRPGVVYRPVRDAPPVAV
jgi:DNA-binding transcriptional LysR family regulator